MATRLIHRELHAPGASGLRYSACALVLVSFVATAVHTLVAAVMPT